MELTKKTSILFPAELHRRLTQIAEQRGTSLSDLVRRACEHEYRRTSPQEKMTAIRRMAQLGLPIGHVCRMKRESAPDPEKLAH